MTERSKRRSTLWLGAVLCTLVGIGLSRPALAQRPLVTGVARSTSDSADAGAVVARFHAALASGDSVGALRLLAPDAVILESGDVETRARYAAEHLPADIAFSRATRSVRGAFRVAVQGDVAWVSSTDVTTGSFHGRPVDSAGAELMVLARTPDGWRIRAIHWSSHRRAGSR